MMWPLMKLKKSLLSSVSSHFSSKEMYSVLSTVLVNTRFKTDMLLFVHFSVSPLCFNCKALHPIFDQLAEHYKDNSDIVIAKTNALENEYPQFTFNRYPGIIYFPKGDKPVSSFMVYDSL